MSKRGRRRNSKRRKSSSSSKQSVSPYIFQKQNKNEGLGYKHEIVEKGETDSLWKENAPSGSDNEEEYNNTSPKEKKLKRDYQMNTFPKPRNIYTKTTEDKEKGVKIVTSVSVNDIENAFPKIMFQQSREPLAQNANYSSTPITNIMEINCFGSHVNLEIQDILQINTSGIRTTLVFTSDGDCAEKVLNNKFERTWLLNSESSEHPSKNVASHNENQKTKYRFTFGSMKEQTETYSDSESVRLIKIWDNPNYSQCLSDHKQQLSSEFILENHPLNISSLGDRNCFHKSISTDQFWDIPPPQEFADIKYNSLEDLTLDLASLSIEACSPADEHQREVHQTPNINCNKDSGCLFSVEVENKERTLTSPSFDQLSESDNCEPMLMRLLWSTNRSSFTKDFINHQKRKSWIRNNSIATVEHKACLSQKRRRQTYPGVGLRLQEDLLQPFSESFSSLIMCLLPLQTVGLGNDHQCDDRFPAFGLRNSNSLQTKGGSKPVSEILKSHDRKQSLLYPFYMTNSEDNPNMLTVSRQSSNTCHHMDLGQQDINLKQDVCEDKNSMERNDSEYRVDQSDISDSGFNQEMGEFEYLGQEPHKEELSGQALATQLIPPSCSGSEEQMLQSNPVILFQKSNAKYPSQENLVSVLPKHGKSSVMTITVGALEQNFLQMHSRLSVGSYMEKHTGTVVEDPCMILLQDINVHSLNTNEVAEETQSKPFGKNTRNINPSLSLKIKESNYLQLDTEEMNTENLDKLTDAASCPAKCFTDTESKEELSKTDKADKQIASRSYLDAKDHLKPVVTKDPDSGCSDHWAKRRKLFKESKQWSSAGGSSITSDITEESEDTHSMDMTFRDNEDRGFYTETFHSSAWIYQGDDTGSGAIPPSLNTRTRAVSIRERTVKISKGTGEYPWGFRIQFSKPIVVTEVDTNGAAEEAGLIVGDYVLAVNGTDVTSIPHSEAADLARQGPDLLTLTVGSDIARGPNTPRPACRGYLHKRTQSGLIKGWRKRWFVLTHDCCLYYYRHKKDEGKRRALSAIKLEGAEVGSDISLGKPFVFKCRPQSDNRVYFFCATSNQEMKRWLEAMEKAIHPITQNHVWVDVTRHNSNLPPLAVKNPECLGLLHKMDKSKDMWVQHYCILKDGCLYLYSGIRSTHAHGGIYLQGYMVREQPCGSKKSTIELKPPSEEFRTFYLCAENPNENKRWIVAIKASIKKWLPLHQALQDYMNRPPEETRM